MARAWVWGWLVWGGVAFADAGAHVVAYPASSDAFVARGAAPFADYSAPVFGTASLDVTVVPARDRAPASRTLRVEAQFQDGVDQWLIALDWPRAGAPEPRLAIDRYVHGSTGLGSPALPRSHAAAAVWGQGTVTKNGQVVSTQAQVEAVALVSAPHAHDGTQRLLPQALPGNQELIVVAEGLPADAAPGGFIALTFDDVRIESDGRPVPGELSNVLSDEQATTGPTQSTSIYAGGALLEPGAVPPPPNAGAAAAAAAANPNPEATPGIPATPPVVNGQPATALPSTPGTVNAQPATPLVPSVAPLNAQPGGIAPLNATPAGR